MDADGGNVRQLTDVLPLHDGVYQGVQGHGSRASSNSKD